MHLPGQFQQAVLHTAPIASCVELCSSCPIRESVDLVSCWYSPLLGLVPLVITLIGMAVFIFQTDHLVTLDRAVGAAYDQVNQNLNEGVGGVRVIKAFGLEPVRIDDFATQVNAFVVHARTALAYATSLFLCRRSSLHSGTYGYCVTARIWSARAT